MLVDLNQAYSLSSHLEDNFFLLSETCNRYSLQDTLPVNQVLGDACSPGESALSTNSNNAHNLEQEWHSERFLTQKHPSTLSLPWKLQTTHIQVEPSPRSSKCDEFFSLGRKISIDVTKWL